MELNNNRLAFFILSFILLSFIGNLYIWFRVTGHLPSPQITEGRVSLCVDSPPVLDPIGNHSVKAGRNFTLQVGYTNPLPSYFVYFYANFSTPFGSFNITNTTGLINFTANSTEVGNYTITIRATHDFCPGPEDTETFSLEITQPNRPPYWINFTRYFNLTEDVPFFLNVSSLIADYDNDTLNFTHNSTYILFPALNLTILGIINTTANDSSVGNHSVNITAGDLLNATNSSIFIFNVSNVNDAPLLDSIPDQQACEDAAYSYDINATDEDLLIPNTPEVLHFFDNTSLFVINENTGQISFTPSSAQTGNHSIRFFVTDDELADSRDVPYLIIGVNDAPVKSSVGSQTVHVNDSFQVDITGTDEEDVGESSGALHYNLTFLSNNSNVTNFFDINESSGIMNFTPNMSLLGTYAIRACLNDSGLSPIFANASSYCGDGAKKSSCENFSLTITAQNRAPVITGYSPENLTPQIQEGDTLTFKVNATDPDTTIPTLMWILNGTLVQINTSLNDTYIFTTNFESAGTYNLTINASDGSLSDTVSWVINVTDFVPPVLSSSGGGGGGSRCTEYWICEDWALCQNATSYNSQLVLGVLYQKILANCSAQRIAQGNCGFRTRNCYDKQRCSTEARKPHPLESCIFTTNPSCFDGVRNCHEGECEILSDCGGPCIQCPTCSDKIQNQGEEGVDCGGPCAQCTILFPKPPRCGDNRCQSDELFSCRSDCGFFWNITLISAFFILVILLLMFRELNLLSTKRLAEESRKRIKHVQEIMGLSQDALQKKSIALSKKFYNDAKNSFDELDGEEKRRVYRKLVQLYTDIQEAVASASEGKSL